jgi:glycosyltransferase involved in cell wall biosynthesis
MTTIALVMIVKDEAAVIERALDSAKPLIDYVLIEDTGSSDGTQQIIKDWLQREDVAGNVIEEPWQNFGYNRSHLLAELRKTNVDYAFMLDADEVISLTDEVEVIKRKLSADLYHIDMRLGTTAYALGRLTRNAMPFYYRGPVHEWPDCKKPFRKHHLKGITITEMAGGAREKDPETFRKDAALFAKELERSDLDQLESTRYTFYFAQSLRDCGELQTALDAYLKRANQGGWSEEVYVSLLNAARLQHRLHEPVTIVVGTYKRAIAINPKRVEAIHGATHVLRVAELFHEAYAMALKGVRLPLTEGLFIETWIYDYGMLDEFSVVAYHAGHVTESWLAAILVLCKDGIDDNTRKRIRTNLAFAANG